MPDKPKNNFFAHFLAGCPFPRSSPPFECPSARRWGILHKKLARAFKRSYGDRPAEHFPESAEPTQTNPRARTNPTAQRNAGTGTNAPRVPSPANAGERYNALHRAQNAGRAPQHGTRFHSSKNAGERTNAGSETTHERTPDSRSAKTRQNFRRLPRTCGKQSRQGFGEMRRRARSRALLGQKKPPAGCPVPRLRGPGLRRAAEPRKPCRLYLIMVTLKAENILQSTLQG